MDAGAHCSGRFRAASQEELERDVEEHLRDKHDIHTMSKTLGNYVKQVARER
ncbi:MAG: DUF1059 domain-containing protein [Actinomycetota bacterium]|nr:DUF1059 domain-containing protein [Actinomycetota bacterium]